MSSGEEKTRRIREEEQYEMRRKIKRLEDEKMRRCKRRR